MIKVRHKVLGIMLCGWLFSFFDRMVMSVALPFIGEDFNLSKTQLGFILSAFFAGYALFQIPGGLLADKFGPRRVMTVAITWWSVFTAFTGMVLTLPIMLATRFIFGLGEAAFPSSSWKTISMYFPPKERATATAIQSTVNALGPAIATVVAASAIGYFGWRTVFIALAFPGFVIAAAIFFYIKDNPKQHPQMTKAEIAELEAEEGSQTVGGAPKQKMSFKEFMKKPILWQMTLMWLSYDFTYWGFASWLPSYWKEARGMSTAQMGFYASLPFFIGAVAMVLGGYMSDNFKSKGIHRKWIFIPTAILGAGFLYLMYTVPATNTALIFNCISAFFLFCAFAAFWGIVVDSIPSEIMGVSSATVNFGGQVAGFLAPIIMGMLMDSQGGKFDHAFLFLVVAAIVSACIALTIKDTKKLA